MHRPSSTPCERRDDGGGEKLMPHRKFNASSARQWTQQPRRQGDVKHCRAERSPCAHNSRSVVLVPGDPFCRFPVSSVFFIFLSFSLVINLFTHSLTPLSFSSRFSSYLTLHCIPPPSLTRRVQQYEKNRVFVTQLILLRSYVVTWFHVILAPQHRLLLCEQKETTTTTANKKCPGSILLPLLGGGDDDDGGGRDAVGTVFSSCRWPIERELWPLV